MKRGKKNKIKQIEEKLRIIEVNLFIINLGNRLDKHSQKEHRLLAKEIELIFKQNFPIIHKIIFEESENKK